MLQRLNKLLHLDGSLPKLPLLKIFLSIYFDVAFMCCFEGWLLGIFLVNNKSIENKKRPSPADILFFFSKYDLRVALRVLRTKLFIFTLFLLLLCEEFDFGEKK